MAAFEYTSQDSVSAVDGSQVVLAIFPSVALVSPIPGAQNVSPDTAVQLQFSEVAGFVIDYGSIVVKANSVTVFEASAPTLGWAGRLIPNGVGMYLLTLYAPDSFSYGESVTVEVDFNYMTGQTYADAVVTNDQITYLPGHEQTVNDSVTVNDASLRG